MYFTGHFSKKRENQTYTEIRMLLCENKIGQLKNKFSNNFLQEISQISNFALFDQRFKNLKPKNIIDTSVEEILLSKMN